MYYYELKSVHATQTSQYFSTFVLFCSVVGSQPGCISSSLCSLHLSLAAMVLGLLNCFCNCSLSGIHIFLMISLGFRFWRSCPFRCILSRMYTSSVLGPADVALATQLTQRLSGFSTADYSLPISCCALWKEVTQSIVPEGAECLNDVNSSRWETYSLVVPENLPRPSSSCRSYMVNCEIVAGWTLERASKISHSDSSV